MHAHQVLQHLTDPVAALREMRRVAKAGGIVAVRDADFHGMSWYPAIPELDDWMELYQRIARRNGAEPDAGRRLVSWAQAAGFTDVAPSSSNWLYATGHERRWQARVWGERVLHSSFADQALEYGLASEADLARISAGWHRLGLHRRRLVPDSQRRGHRPGVSGGRGHSTGTAAESAAITPRLRLGTGRILGRPGSPGPSKGVSPWQRSTRPPRASCSLR